MVISETEHCLTAINIFARFLYTRICPLIHNLLRRIRPNRFFRTRTVCVVPSGTPLFPPNCFCPKTLLSDLLSLPWYSTKATYLLLQKSFHCGIFSQSAKTNNHFLLKFLISLVDLLVIFIINYKKYKNAVFSKRN
jgi:hypothetical protein